MEENENVGHHYATEVNEFLVQLNACSKDELLVIGASYQQAQEERPHAPSPLA